MIKSLAFAFIIWSSLLVIGCVAEESGQADFDSGRPGGGSGYTEVDESNKPKNSPLGFSLKLECRFLKSVLKSFPVQ